VNDPPTASVDWGLDTWKGSIAIRLAV